MSIYKLSREETIPMLDENGLVMQMKQFSYSVEITGDENQTLDDVEKELDKAFEKQRLKASNTLPMIQVREKQIMLLLSELKKVVPAVELQKIKAKAKSLNQ